MLADKVLTDKVAADKAACDKLYITDALFRSPKFTRTDADIEVAVRAWANPTIRAAAEITYGHISDWETSQVTSMEMLFCGDPDIGGDTNMHSFNDDISRWDTFNVTTINSTFCHASAFNGDFSRWDTSKVTTMLNKPSSFKWKREHGKKRYRSQSIN